jgi:hypothetical protein
MQNTTIGLVKSVPDVHQQPVAIHSDVDFHRDANTTKPLADPVPLHQCIQQPICAKCL